MSDDVVVRMMAGYAFVDALVADDVDLFAMGNLRYLLELNTVVLCGTDLARREEYAQHRTMTDRRFYEERQGGIRDVMEWYARHATESPWKLAAGIYIRIVSKPQLFIEGNHRTGALAMSYLLIRGGEPPFVVTTENAAAYFDPPTDIRDIRKQGVTMLFRLPGLQRRLATFLATHADRRFLMPGVNVS